MIRIAVFTDEPISGRGFVALLSSEEGFEIAGVWDDLTTLPGLIAAEKPDLLLLDCNWNVPLGLVSDLRRQSPDCRIVMWVRAITVEMAFQAVELGVRGVLHKTMSPERLAECLERVAGGESCVDDALASGLPVLETVKLTAREGQLLTLLARGMKNREIAEALSITEGTVKVYLSRLFHKAGVKDRYQLALFGVRNLRGFAPAEVESKGGPDEPLIPRRGSRATRWPRCLALNRNLS